MTRNSVARCAGRKGRGGARAQALVEFVLVAPIFFLLMFAIIDFGRYVYYVQILNNAAREGTRYAIVHGSQGIPSSGCGDPLVCADPYGDNVKAVVRNYAIGVVGDSTVLDIQATWPGGNTRERPVTVTVTYDFRSLIPVVPIPAIQIEGASTLVINN